MAIIHHIAKTVFTLIFVLLTLVMQHAPNGIVALAQTLPEDELSALREISTQVGKLDWNFTENPCDNSSLSWASPKGDLYDNNVSCNCTFPNSECHVVSISLKGQDLAGVLPPSLAKLPYIKTIDLTRNYLNGTIPREWASTSLEYLGIPVNRLSGPIPDYVGNITTLKHLSIECNQFSGTLPPGLGKLVNLENLTMNSNNLTGELPLELANLVKLKIVRISSNNFTGKIPNIIRNWKQLQKLEMQASGFEGPIPDDISVLTNLTELRISDLKGEGSAFPPLKSLTKMQNLMLRSCKINGSIPAFMSANENLKIVDLSFNNLTGNVSQIPASKLYLTKNLLTEFPNDLINKDTSYQIDLSYNQFPESSIPTNCRDSVNFYRSSSGGNKSELHECLKNFPCSKDLYQLYINCGGKNITIGETNFEGDEESSEAAKFRPSKINWGFSNTGIVWDQASKQEFYMAQNVSILRMNNYELYTTARVSPLSLTYYGRCLANGNYTVNLHFAEIIFRNNKSFQSLGRRIFDVYIQENRVLQDFNIETEAGGVDKVVVKKFNAVVTQKTLEIRFYWAGKGTTMIPRRGIYGPLISAISVESVSPPPAEQSTDKSHDGRRKIIIVVGAVAFVLSGILVLLDVFWWKICLGHKTSMEQDLRGLDLQTGFFTYRQIKAATNNFNGANKIGEGGFGSVYKGTLLDGTTIAVKQLSSRSKQGNREFVNEIGMISALQHPNVVRLYGCCVEKSQLLLVYEHMENNSLARALFGPEEFRLNLDWPTRQRICIGIARGLAFLHEESVLRIVHRDIKATNVLLDKDLNPKISDFGLAKLDEEENSHISTRVAGTIGYMAPEYALWGYLTYKADVFSFGVVALEIVAGKNNMKYRPNEEYVCLLDWALVLQQKGCLMELMDPSLGSEFDKEEATRMIKVALLCTNSSPALRPTMSAVVSMLEGQTDVQELIMDSRDGDELRFRALRGQNDQMEVGFSESQASKLLSDQTSTQDLYPVGFSSTQDLYKITSGSQ